MISMRTFYGLGAILFGIMFMGNVWNVIALWNAMTLGARVAGIAGFMFNVLLCALFIYLFKSQDVFKTPDLSEEEIKSMIKTAHHKSNLGQRGV